MNLGEPFLGFTQGHFRFSCFSCGTTYSWAFTAIYLEPFLSLLARLSGWTYPWPSRDSSYTISKRYTFLAVMAWNSPMSPLLSDQHKLLKYINTHIHIASSVSQQSLLHTTFKIGDEGFYNLLIFTYQFFDLRLTRLLADVSSNLFSTTLPGTLSYTSVLNRPSILTSKLQSLFSTCHSRPISFAAFYPHNLCSLRSDGGWSSFFYLFS